MKNKNTVLLNSINSLPAELKAEALDFIEFLIQKYKNQEKKVHPKAGFLKNTFTLADDFDAHPDDFKEYM